MSGNQSCLENFGLIMNHFLSNFWNKRQKWNEVIAVWTCFLLFLVFYSLKETWNERLYSFDIAEAKTNVPSFENLPDKMSIPTAISGLVFLCNFKISYLEVGEKVNFWFSAFRNLL